MTRRDDGPLRDARRRCGERRHRPGEPRARARHAWDEFVTGSACSGFPHQLSRAGRRVKAANGWARPYGSWRTAARGPIGAQMLVRRLGPGPFGVGYAPRGPVATRWDEASVAAFTEALDERRSRQRLSHVTIEPPPSWAIGRGRAFSLAAGWQRGDPVAAGSHLGSAARPAGGGAVGGLRSKWRQYVSKARRVGIGGDRRRPRDLDAFYEIFIDTARRTGFIPRTLDSYREVWDAFAAVRAARSCSSRAMPDGETGATLFLRPLRAAHGRAVRRHDARPVRRRARTTCSSGRRSAVANEDGARVYDMWGMAHAGIEQFKQGFGGREAQLHRRLRPPDRCRCCGRRSSPRRRAWVPLARRVYHARHGGATGAAEPANGVTDTKAQDAAARTIGSATSLVSGGDVDVDRTRPLGGLIARARARGLLRSCSSRAMRRLQRSPIGRVTLDSRGVEPGTLFAALPGPARRRPRVRRRCRQPRGGGDPGRARCRRPSAIPQLLVRPPSGAGAGRRLVQQ